MTTEYILSQIFVFIAFGIDLVSYFWKSKKFFLLFCIASSVLYVSSYVFLGYYLPVVANSLFFVRAVWYFYLNEKDKDFNSYIIPIIVLNIAFSVAFVFLYLSPLDFFLLASMILLTIGFAFKDMLFVRICCCINAAFWATYNFIIKGYVNFACSLSMMFVILFTIFLYHILPKIKAKRKDSKWEAWNKKTQV